MTLLVHRATFLLRDVHRIERDVDLVLEGNLIAAVGRDLPAPPGAETIDAQGCAVIPGLVNAHTHLYQNFLKGAGAGLRLVPWCNTVIFPMVDVILQEQRAGNQRPAYLWSAIGSLEMIRAGTTCCQNLDVSAEAIFQAWADVGLRGVGAITLADGWIPAEVATESDRLRQAALRQVTRWHDPAERITISLGPSAPFLCSDGLLEWVSETAEAHDLGIHIHVSETAEEVEDSLRDWGIRPLERLESLGLLGERLSAVHCVHVNQAEIDLLAHHGATVVHCPKSNMKLADGAMDWPALKAAGGEVAFEIGGGGVGWICHYALVRANVVIYFNDSPYKNPALRCLVISRQVRGVHMNRFRLMFFLRAYAAQSITQKPFCHRGKHQSFAINLVNRLPLVFN